MSTAGLQSAASAAASSIGRYFSALNLLPSLILVMLTYWLIMSGAWTHSPSPAHAWQAITGLGLGGAAILLVITLAISLVLHPVQFAVVQLFEGYWGLTPASLSSSASRIFQYQKMRAWLDKEERSVETALHYTETEEEKVYWRARRHEVIRSQGQYPDEPEDIMPTRLGNVLRSYERFAGSLYGLDAVTLAPYMAAIAPPEQVEYLNDQRTQLDLAIRTSMTALIATAISTGFLWRHGWWLLLSLLFYGAAYLAYRGAIVTAASYGMALVTLIRLNRFELYQQLHLPLPDDTQAEQAANERLMSALVYWNTYMTYAHPPQAADTADHSSAEPKKARPLPQRSRLGSATPGLRWRARRRTR